MPEPFVPTIYFVLAAILAQPRAIAIVVQRQQNVFKYGGVEFQGFEKNYDTQFFSLKYINTKINNQRNVTLINIIIIIIMRVPR